MASSEIRVTLPPETLFAFRVRELLVQRLSTQKALAAELGISEAYLSDVLKGRRPPTPKLADGIAAWAADGERARWHGLGAMACGWFLGGVA